MKNIKTYQELRALLLFSGGTLDNEPDFEGFAFGNNKVTGYIAAKLALWFTRGKGRDDGNAPFAVGGGGGKQYRDATKYVGENGFKPFCTVPKKDGPRTRMAFCGVTTPSQSATFGHYSPVRNGQGWKYDFKWPGKGDGDKDNREQIYGTRRKHVAGYHAGRTPLRGNDREYVYTIQDNDSDKIYQNSSDDASNPERNIPEHFDGNGKLVIRSLVRQNESLARKIGDVTGGLNAVNQEKVNADATLDLSELFLIGTSVYRCTYRSVDRGGEGSPYEPKKSGSVSYRLEREDDLSKNYVSSRFIETNDSEDIYNETHIPVQKLAIGSISTTRAVDHVELGIKSTVFRQVNGFPNVSQYTYRDIADDFAKEQQTFQMGTMVSYYDRVSLFRLEVKRGNGEWYDWSGEEVFAVHGNTPQPQYNQMLVYLPDKDFYEFRFIPVCGNAWIANGNARRKKSTC